MNKTELISLIVKLIREDKQIRHVVAEMVKDEVKQLLTEVEEKAGLDVSDDNTSSKLLANRHGVEFPSNGRKQQPVEEVPFTKNRSLNRILNETALSMRRGEIAPPMADETKQFRHMGPMQRMSSSGVDVPRTVASVNQMLPEMDTNGNPLVINPNALPDHLQRALTKNYSKLLKKVDSKRKNPGL